MIKAVAVVSVFLVGSGCAWTRQATRVVESASIEAHHLVIVTCDVSTSDGKVYLSPCDTKRTPLPILPPPTSAEDPRTPDAAAIASGLTPAIRDALVACAGADRTLIEARITIGRGGTVGSTSLHPDVAGVAVCARGAIAPARFDLPGGSVVSISFQGRP